MRKLRPLDFSYLLRAYSEDPGQLRALLLPVIAALAHVQTTGFHAQWPRLLPQNSATYVLGVWLIFVEQMNE